MVSPRGDEVYHCAFFGLRDVGRADGVSDQAALTLDDAGESVVNRVHGVEKPDGRCVLLANPPDSILSLLFLRTGEIALYEQQVPRPVESDPLFGGL